MTLDESLGLIFLLFFLLLKKLGLVLAWRTRAVLKNSPSPSEPRLCSCFLQLAAFQFRFRSQSLFCSEGTAGFPGGKQRGRNRDWVGELDPLAVPIWNIASRSSSSSRACMCRGLAVRAVVSTRAPSPNKWSLGVRYKCRASTGASMSKAAIAQLLPCKCFALYQISSRIWYLHAIYCIVCTGSIT